MCAGVGGGLQAGEAAELFGHRNSMHDKVYQHRKVRLGTWVPFARPTCYAHAATLLRTREGILLLYLLRCPNKHSTESTYSYVWFCQ